MPVGERNALFQRRHYNAIAEIIRDLGCVTEFQRRNVAEEFARRISGTNSAFNRDRFVAAATDTGRTDREAYVPAQVPPPAVQAPIPLCEECGADATHIHTRVASDGSERRTTFFCYVHAGRLCCTPLDSTN